MELITYAEAIKAFAIYPQDQGVRYTRLGFHGEVGELTNQVKKMIRDDAGALTDQRRLDLTKELGDVAWYVTRLAYHLGVNLEEVEILLGANPLADVVEYDTSPSLVASVEGLAGLSAVFFIEGPDQILKHEKKGFVEFTSAAFSLIADIADHLGTDLASILEQNHTKLASRAARGALGGSGDNR
jgi:NTP pyrophosphatase (non-canonical NTP hydrolase)